MATPGLRARAGAVGVPHYPWSEFQQTLIATIGEWEGKPESERGQWEYYDHWVATLEKLVDRHELLTAPLLTDDANDHAIAHDPDHDHDH